MASNGSGKASGIFLDRDQEAFLRELRLRLIASAMGMARICGRKKCLRRKRCFGPYDGSLPCLGQHHGLARARFPSALKRLGWPNINEDGTPIERKGGSGQ